MFQISSFFSVKGETMRIVKWSGIVVKRNICSDLSQKLAWFASFTYSVCMHPSTRMLPV